MEKLIYKIRNYKAYWRSIWLGSKVYIDGVLAPFIYGSDDIAHISLEGTLGAKIIRASGKEVDFGTISKRVVTTAGVNYLRDDFAAGAGGADISNFKYHACGTGVGAEAIGDTALGTECTTALNPDSTRGVGTQVNSVAKTYSTVATLTFDASAAVTEHGIFSAASAGTLWDRSVFAAINVLTGDSIQFTYTLTIADNG